MAKTKAAANAVHRPLNLASPHQGGADVRALQGQINKRFAALKIERCIVVDGELGNQTFDAAEQVVRCLGGCGAEMRKFGRHTISEGAQKLIRGRRRSRAEKIVGKARSGYRKHLRARYAKTPGQKAVQAGERYVGVHEEPAGSNWGPTVSEFIRFTGYTGPVYWCGCFACWVAVKLGGARIPNRIRMGYAPYVTEDALAGRNGFTAVPIHKGRRGDVVCLWGGEHVVTLRADVKAGDKTIKTLEGNTSASNGSQSNGGCVAIKERDIADVDAGIAARPAWR